MIVILEGEVLHTGKHTHETLRFLYRFLQLLTTHEKDNANGPVS